METQQETHTHIMFVFSAERVRAHDFRDNLSGRHLIEVYPFASAIQPAPRKGLAELGLPEVRRIMSAIM